MEKKVFVLLLIGMFAIAGVSMGILLGSNGREDVQVSPLYEKTLDTALRILRSEVSAPAAVAVADESAETKAERVQPRGWTDDPDPTRCTPLFTWCPVKKTECPIEYTCFPAPVLTECPEEYTVCPEEDTKCPQVQTECPFRTTQCPVVETQCPICICPPKVITSDSDVLEELYQLRDNVLAKNETGRELIRVAGILLEHRTLAARSRAILREMTPGIRLLLRRKGGRNIAMTSGRIARINGLFEDIGEEGSEELAETLSMLSNQLGNYRGMRIRQIWQAIDGK
jgi:hypothetical protein